MGKIIYVNGELVPSEEASVSVFDRGLLYGDGLFETLRLYDGIPFLLGEHLKRLLDGAHFLEIKNCPSPTGLREAIRLTIEVNPSYRDGVLRVNLTRGRSQRGLSLAYEQTPSLFIIPAGLPYRDEFYEKGVSVITVPDNRGKLTFLKTLNFLPNVLAKAEAEKQGALEAIFIRDDRVTEGTISNVFAVFEGSLVTPPLGDGMLPGITRSLVLRLARDLKIDHAERTLTKLQLLKMDEVFLTNSVMEIMPVAFVDGVKIGESALGEITRSLRRAYAEFVRESRGG